MLVLGDHTATTTRPRPRPRSESAIHLVFLRAESNNRGGRRSLCQDRQSVRIRRSASGSDPGAQTAPGPRPLSTVNRDSETPLRCSAPPLPFRHRNRHNTTHKHNIEHKPTHVVWRGIRSREAPSG